MVSRGTIIAALVVVELAIVGGAAVAIRPDGSLPWLGPHTATDSAGPRLAEDGPHTTFDAGAHPVLTVDIGYADLTIVTRNTSQIDVAVSKSRDFGFLRARAPIVARTDGAAIRIAANGGRRWSSGDDRMVTVLVPAETRVTVVSAGDIKANGLRAEASFNSTGAGSVTVEDYDAPALRVASSNGRISLHRIVAARFNATSRNGRIEGTGLQLRDGNVESNGRVVLGFATGSDTLVTAETNNGRVSVAGFTAAASAAAGDGGADSSSHTVRVGAGNGHLDVHASNGNIVLAQEV